ncbi:MAG: beta-glucosidase, partial [Bacteroidetes bacterium]
MIARFSLSLLLLLSGAALAQSPAPLRPLTESGEYLNTVQEHTFRYFWDFAHPVSGLTPERTATPNIVTSGGTGFGVMAIVTGVHRGWISRKEALVRLHKMTDFLEKAERFHGAWSHWLDGRTGKVVPFGQFDNGGDLVETAYLINGLLVARAYFDGKSKEETALRQKITRLWESVEWDWYVHEGLLLWHWSPNYEWKMNHAIGGYNECLITYVLALGSPTHPITPEVYEKTWKQKEAWHYVNGKTYLGYQLPIGF